MSYKKIPLLAGVPLTLDIPGMLLLIDSTGVAGGVDVQLVRNGTPGTTMPDRKAAFRHVGAFDAVTFTAAVDTTVAAFLSNDDVQLGLNDGSSVKVPDGLKITNEAGEPIPVLFGGTVAPVFGSATVTNDDAAAIPVKQKVGAVFTVQTEKLTVLADHTPGVINTGAAQLLISDATFKRLRVKNASAVARVAIGGVAVTMANAAIILEPGDMWTEDDAPGAAWYATSDTAAADVRVLGVK